MLNKVPGTVFFWIIKIPAPPSGRASPTASARPSDSDSPGVTTILFGVAFAVVPAQFQLDRYVPGVYWLTVVLVSVFRDARDRQPDRRARCPALVLHHAVLGLLLAVVFSIWYARERTLSIHTIVTASVGAWYWTAVLVTFALGTAVGTGRSG